MKRLRCLLCVLLLCVTLLPVYSVSASAFAVDDCKVYTAWWESSNPNDFELFESVIIDTEQHQNITIQVDVMLPHVVQADTTFNFEMALVTQDADNINLRSVLLKNTDDATIESLNNFTFKDGTVKLSGVQTSQDVKYIRFYFDITNPVWLPNDITTFNSYELKICIPLNGVSHVVARLTSSSRYFEITELGIMNDDCSWKADNGFLGFASSLDNCINGIIDYAIGTTISVPTSTATKKVYAVYEETTEPEEPTPSEPSESYYYEFTINSCTYTEAEEKGLLNSIISFIKKIYNGIVNLPSNIANSIKNLFVPTQEDILNLKTQFENILKDRFGAVYESAQIVDNFANAFMSSPQSVAVDTITFPEVTVNLVGTDFTFGGWEVDVYPDGFEGLINSLKLIVDIACTFMFLNAMRNRLEGLLG